MSQLVNSVMPGLADKMRAPKVPTDPRDLIKSIDAKIAELEKEERERKAKSSSIGKIEPVKMPVSKDLFTEKSQVQNVNSNKISSEDFATKITNKVNSSVKNSEQKVTKVNENFVTDDQFFDDFFSDDDI